MSRALLGSTEGHVSIVVSSHDVGYYKSLKKNWTCRVGIPAAVGEREFKFGARQRNRDYHRKR
jgi:hypothetical protein